MTDSAARTASPHFLHGGAYCRSQGPEDVALEDWQTAIQYIARTSGVLISQHSGFEDYQQVGAWHFALRA